MAPILAALVGLAGGAGAVFVYNKKNENGGKNKADDLVRKAKNEEDERRKEWKKTENRLSERESLLDGKLDQLEKKSEKLNKEEKSSKISKTKSVIFALNNTKNSRKSLAFPNKKLAKNSCK